MSNKVVKDGPCRVCREKGGDRSGNHRMYFSDGASYCNRCNTYYTAEEYPTEGSSEAPNLLRSKTPEEMKAEVEDAQHCAIGAVPSRGIEGAAAERFGFRIGVSTSDGVTPTSVLFPRYKNGEITGYKVKNLLRKSFYQVGDVRGSDLVGMKQALQGDTYKGMLFITEDDLSMASVYQVLQQFTKPEHKGIKPAVVALPDGSDLQGTKVATLFEKHKNDFEKFKEIIMVMDADEAGEAGAEMARRLFPDKVKIVNLPLKDPNDMLMAKRNYELSNLVRFEAKVKSPDSTMSAVDLIQAALEPPKEGESYPWKGLFEMVVGQRDHEFTTIGGGSGGGKSTIAYQLAAHNITKLGRKVGVAFMEEQSVKALRHIVGRHAGANFNDPRVPFKQELFLAKANEIAPFLEIYDNKGVSEWGAIITAFRWWHIVKGCTVFFMDNITAITSHLSPSEMNTEIGRISKEVADFVNEFPVHVYMFSHLNPPKGGASHEEGGEGKAVQLTGSRHLQRYSHNIWMHERNAHAETEEGRNTSRIRVVKNREYGTTGVIHVKYDNQTTLLTEIDPEDVVTQQDELENPFARL